MLILFLSSSLLVNGQINDYNYSIKNRWTIKSSISRYRSAFQHDVFMFVGDFFDFSANRKKVNFKVETNYGVNKFIELGLFIGFQHYEYLSKTGEFIEIEPDSFIEVYDLQKSFAPLFGATANFHILPFFIKSKSCHWDLYLTAKYGGCYLPHYEMDFTDNPYSRYRQEYGLGLGVSYYIKNIIGFYAEASIGQFAFFPGYVSKNFYGPYCRTSTSSAESNFSFRIGVAAKIIKKH